MVTIRDGYRVKGVPMRSVRYCVRGMEGCQISGVVVMRVPPMRVRQKGSGVGCYFLSFRLICCKNRNINVTKGQQKLRMCVWVGESVTN